MSNDLEVGKQVNIQSIVRDWKAAITSPKPFFENMPLNGDITEPAVFYVALATINAAGTLLFSIFNPLRGFQTAVMTLIGMVIASFIHAAITMGLSRLFGGKGGYANTYRACAYSAAPSAVAFVPVVGFLAALYSIYLLVLGVKRAQELDTTKAALVVAIEVVLGIGFAMLIGGLLAAVMMAGRMGH